ncbi:MAG: hypothetical protein AAFR21_15805 [Pseudomonadota bacterium]
MDAKDLAVKAAVTVVGVILAGVIIGNFRSAPIIRDASRGFDGRSA